MQLTLLMGIETVLKPIYFRPNSADWSVQLNVMTWLSVRRHHFSCGYKYQYHVTGKPFMLNNWFSKTYINDYLKKYGYYIV